MNLLDFPDKNKPSSKNFQEFIVEVSKLEAIEFLGLTKIFKISLVDGGGNPREFELLLSDVLDGYLKIGRKQRRELLKVLKLSNLQKIQQ